MPVILLYLLCFLFLASLGHSAFAAEVSRASVAADCREEGKAMGVPPRELNDYVRECIKDYVETELGNLQKQSGR